jgi:uncharacterized protein (DUF1330 family)
MPGYVIVGVEVLDPESYRAYQQRVPPTVQQFGGRFVVRGGEIETLEGEAPPRLVVLEFPSVEQARAWYHSPEYQAILPLRLAHSRAQFLAIVPGAVSP